MNITFRIAGICGAAFGLSATALAAIGSHALAPSLDAQDLRRYGLAVGMMFMHALALVAIGALARTAIAGLLLTLSSIAMVIGVLAFSGSLLARVLFDSSSMLAPAGGIALMIGWLLLAIWFFGAQHSSR